MTPDPALPDSGDTPLVVAAATVDDMAAVVAVATASWHATYGGFLRRSAIDGFLRSAYSELALRRTLAAGLLWTLRPPHAGSQPIGYSRLDSSDGRGSVGALYLLPEWQRRGGGRLLMEHALAWFTSLGLAEAELMVATRNGPARAFYRRLGFVEGDSVRSQLFGDELVELRCRRPLP